MYKPQDQNYFDPTLAEDRIESFFLSKLDGPRDPGDPEDLKNLEDSEGLGGSEGPQEFRWSGEPGRSGKSKRLGGSKRYVRSGLVQRSLVGSGGPKSPDI